MPERHSVVTIAGRNKEAAKTAANLPLVFTEIALGDGTRFPSGGETTLENETHRGLITGSGVEGGQANAVWFDLYVPAGVNTFYAQEIGLFDEDGTLYALSRFAEPVPKFGPDSSSTSDNTFRIIIVFSDTENVIVQTNPVAGLTAATLGQYLPWATDAEALIASLQNKIIDPKRLWLAIKEAFGSWPQAGIMSCICAIDQAGAIAAGLEADGHWLDSDAAAPKVYAYDGADSTEIDPKPNAVWCENTNTLWVRGTDGVLAISLDNSAIGIESVTGLQGVLDGINAVETGALMVWPLDAPPSGYLECNGAAISRTTYASLFAVIGSTYGDGDGVATFNIPDLRGEFLRSWDHAAARDPDSANRTDRGDGVTGDHVGTKQADVFGSHSHTAVSGVSFGTGDGAQHPYPVSAPGSQSGVTGGNETRPRNMNVMIAIRF